VPEKDVILEADSLRVVFYRSGDRYAHRVETFDAANNEWHTTLESLEGEPGDEWPPSPPFQQLHVERRPTGMIVFLIGMAGRTHWSAAVEVGADRQSIQFDVAARAQLPPKKLGSEYLPSPIAGEMSGIRGDVVQIESTSPLQHKDRRIEPTAIEQVPATIAWRYAFKHTA
jgi:hypothetical protein